MLSRANARQSLKHFSCVHRPTGGSSVLPFFA